MGGPGGTFTIQQILEGNAEENWRRQGVPEEDIKFSRVTGMDAGDIRGFRNFSSKPPSYLIIVRCPKVTARPHYNTFQPKPGYASDAKSGTSGLLVYKKVVEHTDGTTTTKDKLFVSDYDLMSIWRRGSKGFEKISVSAKDGRKKGKYTPEATVVIRELNWCMESRSRIQHGCQDDWNSTDNPGVMPGQRYAAFNAGKSAYFEGSAALGYYYYDLHLPFPYDGNGKYNPSKLG